MLNSAGLRFRIPEGFQLDCRRGVVYFVVYNKGCIGVPLKGDEKLSGVRRRHSSSSVFYGGPKPHLEALLT